LAFAEAADALTRATADQQAMKDAAAQFAEQFQALLGNRLDDLLAMLEESGDLVTFRDRLAELIQQDPPQALTDSLVNAGFNAGLLGATQ
jgi:light-regulated signal transduction histidine kinase (bacteriophytochrome)